MAIISVKRKDQVTKQVMDLTFKLKDTNVCMSLGGIRLFLTGCVFVENEKFSYTDENKETYEITVSEVYDESIEYKVFRIQSIRRNMKNINLKTYEDHFRTIYICEEGEYMGNHAVNNKVEMSDFFKNYIVA